MTRARVGSVLAVTAAALLLAGCTGAPAPAATMPAPAPSITPQAGTGPQGETPAAAEVPTCDNMLPESLIKQYKSMGWTAQQNALYAADAPLEGSIQCTWGDYSTSSDAVQIYAFSPIGDTTAVTMQDYLIAQGWTKEQDGDTVYITAGDRSPARDENGYGMTYKFAAGYVTYADTKQALLLITWPR